MHAQLKVVIYKSLSSGDRIIYLQPSHSVTVLSFCYLLSCTDQTRNKPYRFCITKALKTTLPLMQYFS